MILLDLDGVLADWARPACRLVGLTEGQIADLFAKWPKDPETNLPIYGLHRVLGMHRIELQGLVDRQGVDWWASLPVLPGARELFKGLLKLDPEVVFCTDPGYTPGAATGKLLWLQRHFPERSEHFHLTSRKADLARPTRILIDDSPENCEAFRQQGGKSILFGQPWNSSPVGVEDVLFYLPNL